VSLEGEPTPLLLGMGWFPDQAGGLNRYFCNLLKALTTRGVAARAVVVGPVADPSFAQIQAACAGDGLGWRLWRFTRAAGQAAAGANMVDAHFALYGFVPTVIGQLRRLPLVVHFQGPWAEESASAGSGRPWSLAAKRWMERAMYRRAREIVVLSGAFRRILMEGYQVSPWRIHVIAPGVDLDHFRPGPKGASRAGLGIPDHAWVCLSVRRLVPRMGLDVLLEAWSALIAGREDLILLIAGDGPIRKELEVRTHDLGIESNVRFLGTVSEQQLLSCYHAADVCVVPSVALEGFGLVVLEALACGTPVVATDAGGLPEAVSELNGAAVVPAGDAPALAHRLRGALDGTAPLPSRELCRSHAERFSWEAVADRNVEVYRLAIQPSRPSKLRVVYLDHCAEMSGGELALARLLPALEGVESHVMLAEDGPLVSRLVRSGISVEVLPMAEATRGLRRDRVRLARLPLRAALDSTMYVGRLAHRLRRVRPDLVHTNSLKSALCGGLAGRLAGVPVVWHIRDRIAEDYLPRSACRLIRALARRVPAAVIVDSRATLQTLPDLGKRSRVIPSPIAITHQGRPPIDRPGSRGLRVGMVGRIASWKGQHVFLEAFARAFANGGVQQVPARAVIIGSPLFAEEAYEREIKDLAARLGLEGRLECPGFVDDVGAALAGLDILVHASVIPEPFGQVVVEGMAAGLPVVASSAGGPAEVIEDGVTGILYPPGDIDALADALKRLAGAAALRRRLGEAATEKAREFTPGALAPKVVAFYRDVLAREEAS
jgi:glycosyltransferase involved in cell wall biosynthesis